MFLAASGTTAPPGCAHWPGLGGSGDAGVPAPHEEALSSDFCDFCATPIACVGSSLRIGRPEGVALCQDMCRVSFSKALFWDCMPLSHHVRAGSAAAQLPRDRAPCYGPAPKHATP